MAISFLWILNYIPRPFYKIAEIVPSFFLDCFVAALPGRHECYLGQASQWQLTAHMSRRNYGNTREYFHCPWSKTS